MCTVSINIDEATMRQINPSLTSRESIGRWLQHQVDLMLEEVVADDADRLHLLDGDLTPERLYSLIAEEIDDIYANG